MARRSCNSSKNQALTKRDGKIPRSRSSGTILTLSVNLLVGTDMMRGWQLLGTKERGMISPHDMVMGSESAKAINPSDNKLAIYSCKLKSRTSFSLQKRQGLTYFAVQGR
jgi:hypothetical protein